MSYKTGYNPSGWWLTNTQSVNPLTWTSDTSKVFTADYEGTVVLSLNRKLRRDMAVQIKSLSGKVLWVDTKAPWLRMMKNLHVADYGLFYHSIRKNVAARIRQYQLEKKN